MEAIEAFQQLSQDIRTGDDPFARRAMQRVLARRVTEYEERFPRQGGSVLKALHSYYFNGARRRRALIAVLRRELAKQRTPDWLRVRCLVLLAATTHPDSSVSVRQNFRYRAAALRIAQRHAWHEDALVVMKCSRREIVSGAQRPTRARRPRLDLADP